MTQYLLGVVFPIRRIGGQPEKTKLSTVVNPARGLLNREKRAKRESLAAHPPPNTPQHEYKEQENGKNDVSTLGPVNVTLDSDPPILEPDLK